MQPPTSLHPDDHLRSATELLVRSGLRGLLVGFLDEADIAHSHVAAAAGSERAPR